MVYIFVAIVAIGLILFAVSFFMDDRVEQLEEQLEQFSIATMQDTYQMKKKIKILEEELLTENVVDTNTTNLPPALKNKPLLVQKVYHLHQHGYSNDDIAKQTDLDTHDIQTILQQKL